MKALFGSRVAKVVTITALVGALAVGGFTLIRPTGALGTTTAATAEAGKIVRTISATGEGKVEVKPDIAYVNVGVTTNDKDAKKVQELNTTAMDAVTKALKGTGVADADIQTLEFYLNPDYDYSDKTPKVIGYTMTNVVRVRVTDIKKVGTILDAAFAAGANTSRGVQFDLKDPETARNQALENAYAIGKKRAETMAKASGTTLGDVISISESGATYQPVYRELAMDASMKTAAAAGMGDVIQEGSLTITANISVTYEMK